MNNFFSQLLNLIYKKRCYFCGKTNENVKMCSVCYGEIEFLPFKPLKRINGINLYSASVYTDKLQKLIRGLKYHNQKELALFQAKLMFDYWKNLEVSKEKFVIVPVPLFKKREKKRKYNHMMLVAQEFSRLTGYLINNDLVKRIKDTKPQFNLSMKERAQNLKDAFEYQKGFYNGEKLLIIDDILTTGSTLCEMTNCFKADIKDVTMFVTSCTEYNLG